MFSRVFSGAVNGIDAYRVEVEVDCSGGMGQICIVGLPDAAVKESQERVRSAIRSCRFIMPSAKKWVVNLAPADTRKEGPSLDLPIAVGVLASSGHIPAERLSSFWILGELGLDGAVRGISGALPVAQACKNSGVENLVVPVENAAEASLLEDINVFAVSHLKQVFDILSRPSNGSPYFSNSRQIFERVSGKGIDCPDFSEVRGQDKAKRALLIAAAGRHNVLMAGPPGSGKSMLAQRMPGILPALEFEEAIELTKIYSVAGKLQDKSTIVTSRPFRSPHHSASLAGLLGGGVCPRPGEISLSHKGILFLDEMTEFPRSHLESLREPMENGTVTISRAHHSFTFPANFLLVGACNPCPCGYAGDLIKRCVCSPGQAMRYWSKLSGPVLDRIDLHVDVLRLADSDYESKSSQHASQSMRLQVERAVQMQKQRTEGKLRFNGQLSQFELRRYCKLDNRGREILSRSVAALGLSARAYDRILRVARTIADLAGKEQIEADDLAEAINLRRSQLGTCALICS